MAEVLAYGSTGRSRAVRRKAALVDEAVAPPCAPGHRERLGPIMDRDFDLRSGSRDRWRTQSRPVLLVRLPQ